MKAQRRAEILEIINSKPFISLHELEELYPDISSMTLRRDIEYFEQQGVVIKVRGGAKSMKMIQNSAEEAFNRRLLSNTDAKDRIAQKALSYIEPGRSIFFDSGTTMIRVAEFMPDQHVTVTTSGLNVAAELAKKELPNVNIVGGLIHKDNITVSGTHAVDFVNSINIDIAFIVPSGMSPTAGLTCGNYIHCELKSLVTSKAKKVIVLVDSSKISKSLPYTFCGFDAIDVIISEKELPADIRAIAEEKGIQTVIA